MIGVPSAGYVDPTEDIESINLAIPINVIRAFLSGAIPA
jgi:hypothetical protein